ncbi:MAG: glycosyltransferase family 2 protein [Candidatus Pacebacteria bacterium]|nr:glycosyltransferase family 2 protein [Candidatus Paceibacterota bacterium]
MKISVVIATRNRVRKLRDCLGSILGSSFSNFEIILIDQGVGDRVADLVRVLGQSKIHYFHRPGKGKSRALNFGLTRATGEIIVFTDDDCLAAADWLLKISRFLKKNPGVAGVFGQTLPYQPQKHPAQYCPATFIGLKTKFISRPDVVHYQELGQGNNMSFRQKVLAEVGGFKTWLGVGSVSLSGGEESEMIYRILKKGFRLAFEPGIKVFHNRWLSDRQRRLLEGRYACGLRAFQLYYLLKGELLMWSMIKTRFKKRFVEKMAVLLKEAKKSGLAHFWKNKKDLIYLLWEGGCNLRGSLIGSYYYLESICPLSSGSST